MSQNLLPGRSLLALGSRPDVRIFRNLVGEGWTGRTVRTEPGGLVLLAQAQRVTFGLFPGSGDLMGWRSITITPDMVGKTFARVLSVEIKGPRTRTQDNQVTWRHAVTAAGGLAGVARSPEQALLIAGLAS